MAIVAPPGIVVVLSALAMALANAVSAAACSGLHEARALYAAGDYEGAAALAEAADTPDAAALAARALAAEAVLSLDAERTQDLAQRAEMQARSALAGDPDHTEARLQLAIALWLEGRSVSALRGHLRGLPQRGRDLLESAVADAPDDAWAHALLGAWHFEITRRGGDLGRQMYGASIMTGAEHFYRAMELAPDDAAIAVSCALAFLAIDPARYDAHARAALLRAEAASADDAFEAAMKARGARIAWMMEMERDDLVTRTLASWAGD